MDQKQLMKLLSKITVYRIDLHSIYRCWKCLYDEVMKADISLGAQLKIPGLILFLLEPIKIMVFEQRIPSTKKW